MEDHAQAARVAATIAADYNSSAIIGNILGGGIFRPGQIFTLFEVFCLLSILGSD